MQPFKDSKGRTWQIEANVSSINRVKNLTQCDLLDIENKIHQLSTDPMLLVNVLYAFCEPQAKALSVTDIDFGEGFSGDVIDHATRALLLELADFFPKPAQRAALKKLMQALDDVTDRGMDLITQRIEALLPQKKAEAMEKVNQLVASLFTDSPGSSASAPTH
jgi:hypothetical protein